LTSKMWDNLGLNITYLSVVSLFKKIGESRKLDCVCNEWRFGQLSVHALIMN